MIFILTSNPFIEAFVESDAIGKLIFIALIVLSIISWSIILQKIWLLYQVKETSFAFRRTFQEHKNTPLTIQYQARNRPEYPNSFFIIYEIVKTKTKELFGKNQQEVLSSDDIACLDVATESAIASLKKYLDKHLYILSTIVTLAPFLGLLGTVYGILITFSGMKADPINASNQAVLGGLSLALTTTVIGLINAIPALIGYNALKNSVQGFEVEMNRFATEVVERMVFTSPRKLGDVNK